MYACADVCMCVWMRVCGCVCVFVCVYVCVAMCFYIVHSIRMYVCVFVHTWFLYVCTFGIFTLATYVANCYQHFYSCYNCALYCFAINSVCAHFLICWYIHLCLKIGLAWNKTLIFRTTKYIFASVHMWIFMNTSVQRHWYKLKQLVNHLTFM